MSLTDMLPDLITLFCFDEGSIQPQLDTSCQDNHLKFIATELNAAVLQHSHDYPKFRNIGEAILEVTDDSLLNIIRAPETMGQIIESYDGKAHSFLNFLHVSLTLENCRIVGSCNTEYEAWTALGDVKFEAYGKEVLLVSPKFDELVLDMESPYCRQPLQSAASISPLSCGAGQWSSEERDNIIAKLEGALMHMSLEKPNAYTFVKTYLESILARKDLARANWYTSLSTRSYVGRAVLINPHLIDITIDDVIASIVHEAIHNFLYRIERDTPWIYPECVGLTAKVVSPWTGSSLKLNTYIHACWIYYALACYFSTRNNAVSHYGTTTDRIVNMALKGFVNREYINRLTPYRENIAANMLEQLEEIHQRICSS